MDFIGDAGDNLLTDAVQCSGNHSFQGLGGNDTLVSSNGRDTLDGGSGFDVADFSLREDEAGVVVDLQQGLEANSFTSLANIEGVVGTAFSDSIAGDGNANELSGGAGDDVLDGLAGNDTLLGGAGSDTLFGGEGVDLASWADSSWRVLVDLGQGHASSFAAGSDTPIPGEDDFLDGIEGVIGSAFNDTLIRGGGKDWLRGGTGDDSMSGGDGNDELLSGLGNNVLDGGSGFDVANYFDAVAGVTVNLLNGTATGLDQTGTVQVLADTLISIEGVKGSLFDDSITGNGENNRLIGAAGHDTLDGGAGNDTLNGGADADVLTGGIGADLFRFVAGEANGDSVTDFSGALGEGDRLEFAGYGPQGAGASFSDLGGGFWQISAAGGGITEIIFLGGATVSPGDWAFV